MCAARVVVGVRMAQQQLQRTWHPVGARQPVRKRCLLSRACYAMLASP